MARSYSAFDASKRAVREARSSGEAVEGIGKSRGPSTEKEGSGRSFDAIYSSRAAACFVISAARAESDIVFAEGRKDEMRDEVTYGR